MIVACLASAANAGQFRRGGACLHNPDDACYWHAQHIIHRKVNLIAYLEADPDVDEGFKGPVITRSRAKIHRLRAAVGIRHEWYPTPCCYRRKPIHIR
jgi:hypothetical protein